MFLCNLIRHVSEQNFQLEHFDFAKEFAFRKSEVQELPQTARVVEESFNLF